MGALKKLIPGPLKKAIKKAVSPTIVAPSEYRLVTEDGGRLGEMRVLVTGASGGIGSAIVHRLLVEGAVVGACARSEEKLAPLRKGFEREGLLHDDNLVSLVLDVTDDESVRAGIGSFVERCGGIDALVNNAGGSARDRAKPFVEQDFSVLDEIVSLNLRGSMFCAHEVAKALVAQGEGGRIINMSSVVGMRGARGMCDYAAAKEGVVGFTRSLAIELGEKSITVNCVSPGMVSQTAGEYTYVMRETAGNCLGRMGGTDEVARLVAYLLSPDADYITGQNLVIDGGRTLGLMGSW